MSSALGRSGASPHAPLRVGVIGCGNVAYNDHAPAFLALPDLYRVVAVADPTKQRRDLVADRLGLEDGERLETAEELLDQAEIDVLDVCTPPSLHRPIVEAAASRVPAIVCEKPLATTPADAAAISRRVAESGTTFAMIHNYLHFPEVVAVRAAICRGDIGRLQVVLIDSLGVDDNPGAPGYRPNWRHDLGAGGGVLMDLIHLVYLAEELLGGPILRVNALVDSIESGTAVESLARCRFCVVYTNPNPPDRHRSRMPACA
jgi:predicted dehydrogenase